MKRGLWIAVLLLSLVSIAAAQPDYFNNQDLDIKITINSKAFIEPTQADYSIQSITINLSHFPENSLNQVVTDLDITPPADVSKGSMFFRWENQIGKIDFGYETKITTNSRRVKVKEKVPFPIEAMPVDIYPYTLSSETIDSEDETIIEMASKLVAGEDDLFKVAYILADWTKNNIEYNLSTLTAEVNQKASWVLINRQGVCDELTNLFIAMLRAVGIPAKFVSGVAYTNSPLFPENWGSHGWSEVYFPDYGWIPFDVTYGQHGYIDATHVKLKESIDGSAPSIQYRWLARNVDVQTESLDIYTEVLDARGTIIEPISLGIEVFSGKVGFGSYDLIEVTVKNNANYYYTTNIYISRPKELDLLEGFSKTVLLEPNEMKKVYWIVKVRDDLNNGYLYTYPIKAYTTHNVEAETGIVTEKNEVMYDLSEMRSIISQQTDQERKKYSDEVLLNCTPEKESFYVYEPASLFCTVDNKGNTFLEDLNICFGGDCTKINIGISQQKSINFSLDNLKEGKQQTAITIKNSQVNKAAYIPLEILDEPAIDLAEITAPTQVEFDSAFDISFILEKRSFSDPKNVNIIVQQNSFEKTWQLEELLGERKMVLEGLGKDLKKGDNAFSIVVDYQDNNGKQYQVSDALTISLVNVTPLQDLFIWFNQMAIRLEQLTAKELIYLSIGIVIFFILVIIFVFRKR